MATLLLFTLSFSFAQQQGGSIVLTEFAGNPYTTGLAGEFANYELTQGDVVNVKGMYGDLGSAINVNVNYTIFAADWSGIVYDSVEIFADVEMGNLDGIINFDFVVPMDADTAGQHDIITATDTMPAFDFIQVRVVHEEAAGLDVFWYEFVNVRPDVSSSTNDFARLEDLQVYPNPAVNEINIETNGTGSKNVMVYDITGKRVINQSINGDRLDVSNLSSGMHTIRVEQNGKIGINKIMIQQN